MISAPSAMELLEAEAPEVLARLTTAYPGSVQFFSTQRKYSATKVGGTQLGNDRPAVVDWISSMIPIFGAKGEELSIHLRALAKRTSAIRFAGSAIAVVSGGLAGAVALWVPHQTIQAATAFAAMLGGVASATANFFEIAPSGKRINAAEENSKLNELRAALELMRVKLDRNTVLPLTDSELVKMADQLETFAVQLARLEMT